MTDTAMTTRQHPVAVMQERLEAKRDELAKSLPSDITPERFIRALITSAQINPDLQACSFHSLWLACLRACRDGLLPDGVEGAIVPYKSTAQWIPMYRGKLKRVWQTGQFKWVTANVVRKGEAFKHTINHEGEILEHTPGDDVDAPIVKIYALARTKDGATFIDVMPIAEANKHRAMSKAQRDDAPWRMWTEEMLKKTVLHRLMKKLPMGHAFEDEELPEPPPALAAVPMQQQQPRGSAAEVLERFADDSVPVEAEEDTVVWEDTIAPVEELTPAKRHER